jgi:polyisoprenoid-binding protein YceI
MTSLAVQPFVGTFQAQPVPSTFAFGVRHSGVFWFRGSFAEVTATLHGDDDGVTLEGSARVDSISVLEPDALRTHLLGPEFFDAQQHPEVRFRSTEVRLTEDGRAEVDGELTIRGSTCPITAVGQYAVPRESTFGEIAGIELHARLDRRDFGFEWQLELPGGENAVSWDVEIDIDLMLTRPRG